MSLLRDCRGLAARPVLERLRFYESLGSRPVAEVDALFIACSFDDDRGWIGPVFARIAPPARWLGPFPNNFSKHEAVSLEVRSALDGEWRQFLAHELVRVDEPSVIVEEILEARGTRLSEPGLARLERLLTDGDAPMQRSAARILLAAGRVSAGVCAVLGGVLATAVAIAEKEMDAAPREHEEVDDDDEDDETADDEEDGEDTGGGLDIQIYCEAILDEIAKVGQVALPLARAVEHVLQSKVPRFQAAAAATLSAIGASTAVLRLAKVEAALDRNNDFVRTELRPVVRAACWRLSGDPAWLADTVESIGILGKIRVTTSLERGELLEPQLLELVRLADRVPDWHREVCNVLVANAPRAHAAVAELASPPGEPYGDWHTSYHHARWLTGAIDRAQLAAALQPTLADAGSSWTLYVETALGTPEWRATIANGLLTKNHDWVARALRTHPRVALRLVGELVGANEVGVLYALWREDRDAFWRAVGAEP